MDSALLDTCNTLAPFQPRWQLMTPPGNLACAVNSALLKKLPIEGSQQAGQEVTTQYGTHSQTFVTPYNKTHGFATLQTPSHSYKFLLTDTEWAHWLPLALQSKQTVEAALCTMGQMFTALGYTDPRLQCSGHLDFHLHHYLQPYNKLDPLPTRVKPIPLQVL
jgi:hypothetical protein